MSLFIDQQKPWSQWHERLHKTLKNKPNLLPFGSTLLLSVSGGQDSMALLQLIYDLRRLYEWEIFIWHGDHGWHDQSHQICEELKIWCERKELTFFYQRTNKNKVSSEEDARDWRYEELVKQAKILSNNNPSQPCNHILTGHTGSDRAETFIMNLARGAHIGGLSSLRECREIGENIQLIRPILNFSREETINICKKMKIPIWIDPSNENKELTRNRIRKEILPVLETLHGGCTMRIAKLADRLSYFHNDQNQLTQLAIEAISQKDGLSRIKLLKLSITAREMILIIVKI